MAGRNRITLQWNANFLQLLLNIRFLIGFQGHSLGVLLFQKMLFVSQKQFSFLMMVPRIRCLHSFRFVGVVVILAGCFYFGQTWLSFFQFFWKVFRVVSCLILLLFFFISFVKWVLIVSKFIIMLLLFLKILWCRFSL